MVAANDAVPNTKKLKLEAQTLEQLAEQVADLRASAHFTAFLESSEDGLAATKATTKEEQRARKKSKGWGQWFSEKAQAVSSKVGRSSSVAKTPEDVQFDEVVQYVEALEPQVGNVHKHTQGLVRRSRDLANGLFEFGLAFTLLGQSEQGVLENALTEVGHTADKLSVLAAEQAEKEARFSYSLLYVVAAACCCVCVHPAAHARAHMPCPLHARHAAPR